MVEQHDVPVAYLHGGNGGLLPGIEAALVWHQIGERVEKTVTCLVNVIDIRDASADEIRSGLPVETAPSPLH